MDDQQENPQDEHLLTETNTDTLGDRTGVQVFYFSPDQISADNECQSLIKLKQDRG